MWATRSSVGLIRRRPAALLSWHIRFHSTARQKYFSPRKQHHGSILSDSRRIPSHHNASHFSQKDDCRPPVLSLRKIAPIDTDTSEESLLHHQGNNAIETPTNDEFSVTKIQPNRQQQQHRAILALALYASLSREASVRMHERTLLPTRSISSRSSSSSDTDSSSSNKDNNRTKRPPSKTEHDFAEYLTSDQDPLSSTTAAPDTRAATDALFQPPLPHPTAAPLTREESDRHAETYRSIRHRQQTRLEKARAKTATNVRRALTGNMIICAAKLGAWISSGSSSMLSEFIHSVVDCGNQSLLLLGLRDSGHVADRRHPYGYGKSVYFWALVSALGTFFLGAGVSATHAVGELLEPSLSDITWQVWGVLGLSFAVDGWVLAQTVRDIRDGMPKDATFWSHVSTLRDPATLAVLLEDGAATLGIVLAIAGISASHVTGMPVFDGLAGVGISGLLAAMGIMLVRVNHRFLLGHAVDPEITEGIKKILMTRRSIDNVQSVQSQWTGPDTFSYKAEVDFDGTYLAAKLMPRYQREFLEARDTLDQDLRVLLSWYAEDVMRTVEREVRSIETEIRKTYPGAEFIELEPMSKEMDRFAIDDGMEAQLRRIEIEALNRYLRSLYQPEGPKGGPKAESGAKDAKHSDSSKDDTSTRSN